LITLPFPFRLLMKTRSFLTLLTLAVASAPLWGADPRDAIIADITQTRNETVLTHNELATNLQALLALTSQTEGDLRPTFETFKGGLPKTKAAKGRTSERVAKLIAAGQQHFTAWQTDIETINDREIKRHAVARLEATRRRWNDVVSALQGSVQQFDPLLSYLHDIDTALSYDLTANGIRSVRGATASATDTFQQIQANVTRAVSELEKLAKELGSVVGS
jgi:hypothetical protein